MYIKLSRRVWEYMSISISSRFNVTIKRSFAFVLLCIKIDNYIHEIEQKILGIPVNINIWNGCFRQNINSSFQPILGHSIVNVLLLICNLWEALFVVLFATALKLKLCVTVFFSTYNYYFTHGNYTFVFVAWFMGIFLSLFNVKLVLTSTVLSFWGYAFTIYSIDMHNMLRMPRRIIIFT